jgi:hypothetical protein
MLKFDASIFGGELPVRLGVVGIAVVFPSGDFLDEDLFVGNAAIEALVMVACVAREACGSASLSVCARPSCVPPRCRSSNANSLCGQNSP